MRLEKYLVDHFMVRGVNHFVPHAFSAKPFPDPDCPPHFYAHGHNPEYKAFGKLMKYMNRTCECISGGFHVAPIAVLYHGEGEWTGDCLADELITRVLTESQLEFDVVPQDVIVGNEYGMQAKNGTLQIQKQKYEVVLIPYMQFLTKELKDAILMLKSQGVSLYFVEKRPQDVLGEDCAEVLQEIPLISLAEVLSVLEQQRDLRFTPTNDYLRFYHYVKDGVDLFMLVNEGDTDYVGTCELTKKYVKKEDKSLFLYDAWRQKVHPVKETAQGINLTLHAGESRILLAVNHEDAGILSKIAEAEMAEVKGAEIVSFSKNWTRSIAKSIDYPNFGKKEEMTFPEDYAKDHREFSGWFCYENAFLGEPGKSYILDISNANEVVDLYVNDEMVGTEIHVPYRFDLSNFVKEGENQMRIEVATTLEREMLNVPDMFGMPKPEPTEGSGITGVVTLYWK